MQPETLKTIESAVVITAVVMGLASSLLFAKMYGLFQTRNEQKKFEEMLEKEQMKFEERVQRDRSEMLEAIHELQKRTKRHAILLNDEES